MPSIDFSGIAARLLSQAETLIPQWLPGGKRRGHEWVCGDLQGNSGASCSININTGKWSDFASGEKGGDLLSLYAAIKHLSQSEAAYELTPDDSTPSPRANGNGHQPPPAATNRHEPPPEHEAVPAPEDAPLPNPPRSWGDIHGEWRYYLAGTGGPVFVVRRFDPPDQRKQFLPYTWRNGKWSTKSYPAPRPLYRLRELLARPDAPVLVVEGEKSVDAATPYLPDFAVTTWAGGSAVAKSADWRPLAGREVTIWPDNDEPGSKAAAALAPILLKLGCRVRVLRIPDASQLSDGWDVANAIDEDWSTTRILEFIAANAVSVEPPASRAAASPPVDPLPALEGSTFVRWQAMGLATGPNGAPHANLSNAMLVVQRHPNTDGKIWLDTFRQRIYHTLRGDQLEWSDNDDLAMTAWIQQSVGLHKIGVQTVSHAVSAAAAANKRNPLQDWLNGLKWDGIGRLNDWLGDYLGVALTPYSISVGRNFLVSMVARAFVPGIKADHMPVLEGISGRGKSTALEILGGEWFAALPDAFGAKGFTENIQGVWLIEIPDLAGFSKRDHNHIAAFITVPSDRYRDSYGRRSMSHPRTCIFAATSENDEYLQSPIGKRRFWPLRCGGVDAFNLAGLRESREQLFAEAVHEFRSGTVWHETPLADTQAEQSERIEDDPWTEVVMVYASRRLDVTAAEVLGMALNIDVGKQTQIEKRRVAAILRASGWLSVGVKRNSAFLRLWKNPARAVDSVF